MPFDGVQQFVQEKARIVIDLRTMRPKEKQEVVDRVKREYTKRKATWQPADLTEGWIRDSRSGELFQEFITRRLQENAQRKVVWRLGDQVEHNTRAHPLVKALTDIPPDSGGDIDVP